MKQQDTKPVSLRMPKKLVEWLHDRKWKEETTFSGLVRKILEEYKKKRAD